MKGMPLNLKIYTLFIIITGLFSLYFGILVIRFEDIPEIIFFTLLGTIAESAAIDVNKNFAISVSFGIGLATVLVFQSPVIAIIGFFSMLLSIKFVDGKMQHLFNTSFYKLLFNCTSYALSLMLAVVVYATTDSINNLKMLNYNVLSIILAILTYSVIQICIFAVLLAIIEKKSFLQQIVTNSWLMLNVIAIAPLGIFIAIIYNSYGMFAVLLFFGPLLLARYSFKLYIDMKRMYSETIFALSNAVDAKDQYTNGHAHRVADYAVEVSRVMHFTESSVEKIKTAAILHDIGKIGIQDIILNKPGKLEYTEFQEIQKHPLIGANILAQVHNLAEVANIIKYHHEKYEGKGYPEGISGDQVPIESYIISVADAYDAMTSNRPYRQAMKRETAIQIIQDERGKQFHPKVVDAFLLYMKNHVEA